MASNEEILAELRALRSVVDAGFATTHAKLEDVKSDIHLLCDNHLAPSERRKVQTGSGSHWERGEAMAAKPR